MPRPKGSGKPKGYKASNTLDKLAAREVVRAHVTASLVPMLRKQIAHAMGVGHLYTRDKAGKFTRIENEAQIDMLLTTGEEDKDYWIFAKDPSVQAFTDLLNRALDKPKEQEQEIRLTGDADLLAKLMEARRRSG